MPFQKGNKLGTKNKGVPKTKEQQWQNIVGWLVGDGGQAFLNKLKRLSIGKELKPPEREFLEHFKDLLEYHQPKLARTEHTAKDGKDLFPPVSENQKKQLTKIWTSTTAPSTQQGEKA